MARTPDKIRLADGTEVRVVLRRPALDTPAASAPRGLVWSDVVKAITEDREPS
jgi:hypothetical protein